MSGHIISVCGDKLVDFASSKDVKSTRNWHSHFPSSKLKIFLLNLHVKGLCTSQWKAPHPHTRGIAGPLDQASQLNEANSLLCGAISYVKTIFLYSAPPGNTKKIANA